MDAAETDPAAVLAAFMRLAPYARFLGMRAELAGDEMTAILPFSEHLMGNERLRTLHGGVIGGFMEMAALAQLAITQRSPKAHKTINISVEYLRPGNTRDTYARATLRRVGRRVANIDVEAWQDARSHPIAALRGHFLLGPDG